MKWWIVNLLIFIGLPVQAADSTVMRFTYRENEVYHLSLSPLTVTSIHFQGASQIKTVYCGDPQAWDIHQSPVVENSLLLKPALLGSKTNLIVQVDNKSVLFQIESGRQMKANPLLFVNISFPSTRVDQPMPTSYHPYCFKGSPSLKPLWMFDDFEYSYITWPHHTALPAIYQMADNGRDFYLTNFRIHQGVFLLPRLSQQWLLRRGKEQAVLYPVHYRHGRGVCDG